MNVLLRYGLLVVAITAAVVAAMMPLVTSFVDNWSRRDIELRSALVAASIREQVSTRITENDIAGLKTLLERVAEDERILGVAVCDERSVFVVTTDSMPESASCEEISRTKAESSSIVGPEGRVVAAAFPVEIRGAQGHLVLFHQLDFAARRGAQLRGLALLALTGVALGGAAVSALVSAFVMRRWMGSLEQALADLRSGRSDSFD